MAFAILLCASTAAPLQAASNLYWDTDTSGDTWGTGTGTGHTNWSTSSSGGGTLLYFLLMAITLILRYRGKTGVEV